MTVKQLIRKLSKMPQDATVTMSNRDAFENGEYKVTEVEYWRDDNTVNFDTDYKHNFREDLE